MNRVNMHCFWLSRKSFKIFLQKYTKAVCQCIKNTSSVFTLLQFTCIMQREINYIKCLPLLSWIIKKILSSCFLVVNSVHVPLSPFFWVIANGNKKSFCHFFTVRCILEAVSLNARNDSIYARFSMFQSNTHKKTCGMHFLFLWFSSPSTRRYGWFKNVGHANWPTCHRSIKSLKIFH